jgi:nucleotide-binding universal stress UspA family protein
MTIVVGVDGSDGGRRALHFALAEAALRGSDVEAVRTVDTTAETDVTENELWADVESEIGRLHGAPVVTRTVLVGDPVERLLERSDTAELLVLGSHGTNSIIHSALGSVSNACAQLARCPVVVLPRAVQTGGKSHPDGTSARSAGR